MPQASELAGLIADHVMTSAAIVEQGVDGCMELFKRIGAEGR